MTAPMTARVPLSQISSVSWEHPADRAALNSLRALPGFDTVVRRVAGLTGERTVRNLFLGDAVLVGPAQRPALYALYRDVLETLDWPETGAQEPQLYITQSPIVSATAVGFENPFIVISSGTLELLDDDERRFVLAHELGHIMSGHMTYRTMAVIMIFFGVAVLPFLGAVALLPFQLALLEWYRKSELSADRAGLLATQDPATAFRAHMKLASGGRLDDLDTTSFFAQGAEYDATGDLRDSLVKLMLIEARSHPFAVVRGTELRRWIDSGRYTAVLSGDYPRRADDADAKVSEAAQEAARSYAESFRQSQDAVTKLVRDASGAFSAVRDWVGGQFGNGKGTGTSTGTDS
jgi:Zn-dependent protease with chaperone function